MLLLAFLIAVTLYRQLSKSGRALPYLSNAAGAALLFVAGLAGALLGGDSALDAALLRTFGYAQLLIPTSYGVGLAIVVSLIWFSREPKAGVNGSRSDGHGPPTSGLDISPTEFRARMSLYVFVLIICIVVAIV